MALCLLGIGTKTVHSQINSQNIRQEDVYKNDIENRQRLLNTLSQGNNQSRSSGASAKVAGNIRWDQAEYQTQIRDTREAYKALLISKLGGLPTSRFCAQPINPWANFQSDLINPSNIFPAKGTIQINSFLQAQQYGAFWICNLDNTAQTFNISFNQKATRSKLQLFDAEFVLARNYLNQPDALIPITAGITLQPGETRVFMISQIGVKAGTERLQVVINSGKGQVALPLVINNANIMLQKSAITLNTINWAYYFNPMLKNRETAATRNLTDHYINSIVIPVAYLPAVGNLQANLQFKPYLQYCKPYRNILMILDIRKQHKQKDFLTPSWQQSFLQWYDYVLSEFKAQGINPAQKNIYLYLTDEATIEELPYLRDFITWIRKAKPDAKLYATVVKNQSVSDLLPRLDVIQIYSPDLMGNKYFDKDMSKIWIYDAKRKWQNTYSSYRLMPWEAYYKGYGGIGWWNYADNAKGDKNTDGTEWNDFDGRYGDYNSIYIRDNNIYNSRRWESFKVGMEDYFLLTRYGQKYGVNAARALALKVLNNSTDPAAADDVRNTILSKL